MPKLLPIAPTAKASMRALYAAGRTPHEICKEMERKKVTITSRQVSNLAMREGWKRDQDAVAEAAEKDAKAILAKARAAGARTLEDTLNLVAEGLHLDAQQLKDAWDLVSDAAGASALQRAKSLHLARLLKFHDLEKTDESSVTVNLMAAIYGQPVGPARRDAGAESATEVTAEVITPDAGAAPDELDFEEGDHT